MWSTPSRSRLTARRWPRAVTTKLSYLWDVESGGELRTLAGHTELVHFCRVLARRQNAGLGQSR